MNDTFTLILYDHSAIKVSSMDYVHIYPVPEYYYHHKLTHLLKCNTIYVVWIMRSIILYTFYTFIFIYICHNPFHFHKVYHQSNQQFLNSFSFHYKLQTFIKTSYLSHKENV